MLLTDTINYFLFGINILLFLILYFTLSIIFNFKGSSFLKYIGKKNALIICAKLKLDTDMTAEDVLNYIDENYLGNFYYVKEEEDRIGIILKKSNYISFNDSQQLLMDSQDTSSNTQQTQLQDSQSHVNDDKDEL